jgi:nucleotide-binding universal stress UspA family protein
VAGSTFVWVALAIWVLGGLVGYYYLYRHAHPHPGWLLASMLVGPFSLLVFSDRVERSPHVLVEGATPQSSGMRVVVGLDGSPESQQALDVARRLVGDRACCLILCEVVDYDTEQDPAGSGVAEATARVEAVAQTLREHSVVVEVVAGRPAEALAAVADEHDAALIVVGTRGSGLSRRLLGSVAEGLLHGSRRPVLVAHRAGE